MRVGDLVKYVDLTDNREWKEIGIIVSDDPRTDGMIVGMVVRWFTTGIQTSYYVENLEVISESR